MSELNRKLSWLMAIRVLVVLSVLLPYLIHNPTQGDGQGSTLVRGLDTLLAILWPEATLDDGSSPLAPPVNTNRVLQLLVAAVSIQTLLYAALLKILKLRPVAHAYVQLSGDLLLISLLVYKFGAITANLSILYFVVISVASFLVRNRSGLVLASLAMGLYSSVVLLHQSESFRSLWREGGLLAPPATIERLTGEPAPRGLGARAAGWLQPPAEADLSRVPVFYNLGIHGIGFFAVALFTRYLARDQVLERKLAERSQDLAYLKTLHRDVIQSISSGLVATDLDGVTTSVNRAGAEILGRDESELVRRPIFDSGLFTPELWQQLTQRSTDGMMRSELELRRDGRSIFIGFTLSLLRDGEGRHRGYILIFQDLTEWRRLQDQVRIQDRMAAIGQMAAGLAHEVGNPLAAISGSVQMMARRAEPASGQAKLLEITLKESRRLDRTVKSFLQFARPRERLPESFDIAALLAEDVQLLRNSDDVLPGHRIELELDPESAHIVADLDQVGQLFWNLTRNALQAMPGGGRLTISGELDGEVYRITFDDTGKGMEAEERAALFHPFKSFFDSGIGLGMAIVYRIVEEHDGTIHVDSEPGKGTRIAVELPIRPTPASAADPFQEEVS